MSSALDEKYARPTSRHYLWTYGSTFCLLLCNVIAYRLAKDSLGEVGFSEYAVGRRTLSYTYPLLLQGIGVGIAHHVAARGQSAEDSQRGYFIASLTLLVVVALVVLIPVNLLSQPFAYLFFGDPELSPLVRAISVMFCGVCGTALTANFLLGRMEVAQSSLVTVAVGLTPLVAMVALADSTLEVFYWTGVGYLLISLVALVLTVLPGLEPIKLEREDIRFHLSRLWLYAAPRIPGAAALSILLGLPVTLTAHLGDLEAAGVIALGHTMLSIGGALVNPLAMILVPQSTRMLRSGKGEDLRSHFFHLLRIITLVLGFGSVVGAFLIRPVLTLYLGPTLAESTPVLLWMVPTVLPYAWFFGFRSILDGAYREALNAHNTYRSLGLFGVVAGLGWGLGFPQPILLAFLVAVWSLGLQTLHYVAGIFKRATVTGS